MLAASSGLLGIRIGGSIEGKNYLARGSALSFYTFVVPISERMTDHDWKAIMQSGKDKPEALLDGVVLREFSVSIEVGIARAAGASPRDRFGGRWRPNSFERQRYRSGESATSCWPDGSG